jgi:ferredoxin-NADP reductase
MRSHVDIFEGEYNPYLWPLVAIWSFDRFLRLVRLVYCNVRLKLSRDIVQVTSAVATYDSYADVVTLDITPTPGVKPGPGQHYFLYQPFSLKGWENHPFTLGAWSTDSSQQADRSSGSFSDTSATKDIKEPTVTHARQLTSSTSTSVSGQQNQHTLTFWIRPFDGWTRSLRSKCKASPDGKYHGKIILEGPYGHVAPLHCFEAVLLIGGGTGVAALNPFIQEHVKRLRAGKATVTQAMSLIFSSRHEAYVQQVYAKELQSASDISDLKVELYATKIFEESDLKDSPISPISTDMMDMGFKAGSASVRVQHGRPDITEAVLHFARTHSGQSAPGKAWRTAVMVCGPAGMADETRLAVLRALGEGLTVEYFEETFGW